MAHHVMRVRWASLVVSALFVVACGSNGSETTEASTAAPTTEAADDAPAGIEVHFSYSYSPGDEVVQDWAEAAPVDPANGVATGLANYHGSLHYTGDVEGTGWSVVAVAEDPSGLDTGGWFGASLIRFSGNVAECGQGTAVLAGTSRYSSVSDGVGDWYVVDGYGTGELAHMTGSGTTTNHDPGASGNGEYEGIVSCDGSAGAPAAGGQ